MADAHAKKHDYHLVDPSPWPALASISAFVAAIGAVMWMHDKGYAVFTIGMILLCYTAFAWWRDVVKEGEHQGYHTPVVQLGLRYGMIMFIASEVMFFVAWFWAYFNAALFPTEAIGAVWPPEGIEVFDPWHLPFVNTLILLTSGTTVTWAHHALQHGDRKGLIQGLTLTVILGVVFSIVQGYEYSHAAFAFDETVYASTFYMATGFHGAHVIIGTIFLLVCLIRAAKGHFTANHHFGFEAAAWYWHFVDVVWLFLFVAIYWWGAA
ncbi:cytochrome c oxidase subunit 3 [Sneathiella limimaris]|uniref:cytochrome c oxidase subunit 3 n=1 Tax=Sneathiella limimaris TaxID=1964213 RepID=UPI00146A1665|nr:cytochrome c oxidase subunit 3 [Sneathiella limimaris]